MALNAFFSQQRDSAPVANSTAAPPATPIRPISEAEQEVFKDRVRLSQSGECGDIIKGQ